MWNACGMTRHRAGLKHALQTIPPLRYEFWRDVAVPGSGETFNQELEYAGRVADYLEFAELLCHDALHREESCGAHFREDHQTADGEPLRDDRNFSHVAAWEYVAGGQPVLHREPLVFEFVKPAPRSYQ
jgi:succinate dehydrogenase / fumarate reductase flavoprotein subunit